MPYKGGVQLLPETQRRSTLSSYTSGNQYFWTGIGLGIAVIVIGAIFSGYAANLKDQIGALDGKLGTLERKRSKTEEATLLAAVEQGKVAGTLVANKIYWSQALAQMERMTQQPVHYTTISASTAQRTIVFSGVADSYATVAKQLAAFVAGTGVSDAVITSAKTTSQGTVQFDGQVTFDPAALSSSPQPTP